MATHRDALIAAFTVLGSACSQGERSHPPLRPEPAADVQRLDSVANLPATLTVKQRTQTPVPGSSDKLILSIGDITRGKVEASIRSEGAVLLQPVDLSTGDKKSFRYQERSYEITLTELNNALVGEDFATFRLAEAAATEPLTERQKIEQLISRVESLKGAKFIRNGTEHSPQEAAKHLREKRDRAGDRIKTAEEFIEQIASKSSFSGDEYEIRFEDGRVFSSGEFLRRELKSLPIENAPTADELSP